MRPLLLLPLALLSLLLAGCPDTKLPKGPPQVPEPKISLAMPAPAAAAPAEQESLRPRSGVRAGFTA